MVGLEAAALLVLAGVEVSSLDYDRLALGITTTDQGHLTINQAKLDDALAGRVSGVSFDDVRRPGWHRR